MNKKLILLTTLILLLVAVVTCQYKHNDYVYLIGKRAIFLATSKPPLALDKGGQEMVEGEDEEYQATITFALLRQ